MPCGPGAAAAHPRIARVLGPPDAHNAPGPRGWHRVSIPRPRDTYQQGERWVAVGDGPCYPPGALAGGGSRGAGTGAACAELRSPARTAAAARRLQWSSAPQPLLSHGRGALAGRRSGLPAPRLRITRQPRSLPRARGRPAACPPLPVRAGSSAASVRVNPWDTEISLPAEPAREGETPARPVQQWCERWAGKGEAQNDCSAQAMERWERTSPGNRSLAASVQ